MGRSVKSALAVSVMLAAAGAAVRADAASTTRVVESAGDRVVVEVLVPAPRLTVVEAEGERFTRIAVDGAAPWGVPGEPGVVGMPVLVGVPAGARPTVRVLEATTRVLTDVLLYPAPAETIVADGDLPAAVEVFRWDRDAYAREGFFPAERARVASTSRMRFQEIAAVEVYPVRARPARREIEVASRLLIEVRWDGGDVEKGGGAAREPAPADPRWESIYRGLLANPDQARAFRGRPARVAALPEGGPRKAGARAGASPEWKLSILETGLYRLPYENLSAKGFPSDVPVGEIRVFQRSVSDSLLWAGADPFLAVEIPLDVVDAGNDGAFGPGDAVYVYLRDFRAQFMPGDYEDMFTTRAVYWLTFTPGEAGARVAERAGWLGHTGLTPPASFLSTVHFEPDAIFNPDSQSGLYDLWFAVDYLVSSASLGITFTDVDFSGTARFRGQAVGRLDTGGTPHHLAFSANGTPFASFEFLGRNRFRSSDSTFSAAILRNGTNTILYEGSIGGDPLVGSGAYLDWLEFDYPRLYRASGNRLAFTSGDVSGQGQYHVGAFGSSDVRLYDVTDPLAPVRVVVDSLVSSGGSTEIRFQADVASLRRYEAATPGGARTLPDSLVTADTPSALATDEADHVMVVYDEFESGLAPLVAHRQAQGLRVKTARISDVYDEFNGGVPHPAAIRRYMKYALEHWSTPPTYLLLVGDASEDHAQRDSRYDLDYVPSSPSYSQAIFLSGDHWDASDNWYVLLDGPTVNDAEFDDIYFDVLVGRFSVASLSELSVQVAKTIAYETANYAEAWRRRFLLIADDQWITEGTSYRDVGQSAFRDSTDAMAATIDTATTIDLEASVVRLADLTDRLHRPCDDDTTTPELPITGTGGTGLQCVIDSVRSQLTPAIFDSLNDGVLFANFQGHGNRWVLSHEGVILDGFHIRSFGTDVSRFQPTGRPCIFMAYGCSISEFERASPNPNFYFDDCLTEKMMNVPSGGAVGCIGSSGIEFLEPNLYLNREIVTALLTGASGDPPRFILGDINAIGMAAYACCPVGRPFGYRDSMLRYILFGDPALQIRTVPASYTVRVDGVEVPDVHYLAGHEDGSPVRITVTSSDSTVLAALRISRSDQAGEIDTTFYRPIVGDSLVYLHPVEFSKYDLLLRAPAIGGGTRTVTLKVDIQTSFTFDGREILEGDLVDPGAEIVVLLTAPLQVAASEIAVRLDGAVVAAAPDSVAPRTWRIVLPPTALADGEHAVEVSVFTLAKSQRFSVRNRFEVLQPLNYPNPVRGDETSFSYLLTADVDRVDIAIYTVNGRKVREFKGLAGRAGYNPAPGDPEIVWDTRDEDSDGMANGVYLYRVRAVSAGRTAEAIGKLVLLRGRK